MKEILLWNDIDLIEDEKIKKYMFDTKEKATKQQKPWDFKNWGYWVILDSWEELQKPLQGKHFTLPSLSQGLLNHLEIFEEKFEVCEMVYLLNNDFGISLVLQESIIPTDILQQLREYSISAA